MFKPLLITILALAVVAAVVFVGGKYLGKETADETADWQTYRNEKYGFEFRYPADHTAYGEVDVAGEVLIPATPTSDYVAIAEREAHIFCCEPIILEISAAQENISANEWLNKNLLEYTPQEEVKSTRDIVFVGRNAVELIAGGNILSTHRLLVIQRPDHLLIINQNSPSEFIDSIVSTFKFTK